jgi:hypothetical protein
MGGAQWWQARRAISLALALVTILVAVGGCGTGHPSRPAAAPTVVGHRTAVTAEEQARSIIATNAQFLQWSWTLSRAELRLTSQCMQKLGFVYEDPRPAPEPSARTLTADALGSGDPATYGVSTAAAEPRNPGDDQPAYAYALDGPATSVAMMSLPDGSTVDYGTGGCIGSARTILFGSVRAYVTSSYLPQVVRHEFEAFLTADTAAASALRDWQQCMKSQHWDFASPTVAIAWLYATPLTVASLDQRQSVIANADRACDAQSQLRAHRGDALARFVHGLPADLLAQLTAVYDDRVRAGRVAQQALIS